MGCTLEAATAALFEIIKNQYPAKNPVGLKKLVTARLVELHAAKETRGVVPSFTNVQGPVVVKAGGKFDLLDTKFPVIVGKGKLQYDSVMDAYRGIAGPRGPATLAKLIVGSYLSNNREAGKALIDTQGAVIGSQFEGSESDVVKEAFILARGRLKNNNELRLDLKKDKEEQGITGSSTLNQTTDLAGTKTTSGTMSPEEKRKVAGNSARDTSEKLDKGCGNG